MQKLNNRPESLPTSVTLGNGVPIETVSKILGHTSLKTTQIYAKILDKKISEDMDLLQTKLSIHAQKVNNCISDGQNI